MGLLKKKEVSRTEIFENMPPVKAVLSLAIPTILNQLVNIIYNLADTVYIGQLNNPSMVAAISLAGSVMIMLTACCSLMVIGGCAVIAKTLGEGNLKKTRDVALTVPIMAFCFGIIITVLVVAFIEPLSWYSGATDSCIEYTKDYMLWVIGFNAIPNLVGTSLGGVLRGRGYSKYEMFGLSLGNILNIILDPIFIFTFELGVKGAAIATFISSCCSMITFLILANVMQKKEHFFTSYREFKFDISIAKDILTTGFPACFHQFLTSIVNTRFMNLLKTYSDAAVAAVGIGRKTEHVFGQIVVGLFQGSIPLVSYNYGNRNYERLNAVRKTALLIGAVFGVFAIVLIAPFTRFWSELFIKDSETVSYCMVFLKIYAVLPFFLVPHNNSRTVYQAIGMKKKSTAISIFKNVCLFLPLIYIMNHFFGVVGLVASGIAADAIIDIYVLIDINSVMKKIKIEFEQNPRISSDSAE